MDAAVLICDLICVWVEAPVSCDYTVTAEGIVGRIIIIEIATIHEHVVSSGLGRV